jgi:hypothetical protein
MRWGSAADLDISQRVTAILEIGMMQELTMDEINLVSGGATTAESVGMIAGGVGLVVAGIAAAPILSASAAGWAFGSFVAWTGGYIAGMGYSGLASTGGGGSGAKFHTY